VDKGKATKYITEQREFLPDCLSGKGLKKKNQNKVLVGVDVWGRES